jgi:hypothetical protein
MLDKELIDLVLDLNTKLEESKEPFVKRERLYFAFNTSGYCNSINFCGLCVYNSENDSAETVEDVEKLITHKLSKLSKVIDSIFNLEIIKLWSCKECGDIMCEGCEDFASGLCWGCSEKLT